MSLNYISRNDEVIVVLSGTPYVVKADDFRYWDVMKALALSDEEQLNTILNVSVKAADMLKELAEEGIEDTGVGFTYLGHPIALDLGGYLRSALSSGNWKPVVAFVKRLFDNPSHDTRMRLFGFMDKNQLPLQEDGRFLAFKVVNNNYLDKHTETVSNAVGVTVPRFSWSEVDTDPERTCSRGYHACSKDYLSTFYSPGDRVVAVAIAPEDVGAIPKDYNDSKLRCRGYEVVADITDSVKDKFETAKINMGLQPDYEEEVFWVYADMY